MLFSSFKERSFDWPLTSTNFEKKLNSIQCSERFWLNVLWINFLLKSSFFSIFSTAISSNIQSLQSSHSRKNCFINSTVPRSLSLLIFVCFCCGCFEESLAKKNIHGKGFLGDFSVCKQNQRRKQIKLRREGFTPRFPACCSLCLLAAGVECSP